MVRIGKVVLNKSIVASIGENPVESAIKAKKLGADILEMRIDILRSDAYQSLLSIKKTDLPVIITNRMKQEGGVCDMEEDERVDKLLSLLPLADAVDIELCASRREDVVKEAQDSGKTVIISTHNFQETPDTDVIMEIIDESLEAGADIAKLAVTPNSFEDVLRLLEITFHTKGDLCMIAMGERGKHSRVIAPIYGSVMTFGYVETATAPGQLSVNELKYILNILSSNYIMGRKDGT
jgi:3-dehydroquinate dehydratase-1